jgi:glycosyltransferase involved in cell wall biosynthesis
VTIRIGIDARELAGRATGVGRYLRGLLGEWAGAPDAHAHEFVLYAHTPVELPRDARRFRRFTTRVVDGSGGTWWEQFTVPRAASGDRLDVWFAPAYEAPLRLAIPTVVAIHDLSFVAHPEWFRMREGVRRRWLARQTAHKAAAVITISQFSRGELIEHLDVPADRIHVIPPGITPSTMSHQPSAISHGRALYVGSIFNRRHVVDLIRAFAPIARAHRDASLDIVGDNRSYPHEDLRATIDTEGVRDQVRWHEYVPDDELRKLYAHASAFAFLSEYEGLGLTPLEALAAGVTPVLLDTPVARESCGSAAIYVTNGIPAITAGLEAALFDDGVRSRVLSAAPSQLAKYSWPRAGAETLRVIENARSGERSG